MKLAWITNTAIVKGFREVVTRITSKYVESTQTAFPFGFEANPTKNFLAIITETQSGGDPVIIGYLNPKALGSLGIGESAQYSTDSDGNIKASIILRNDGTAEILGNNDNAVRYSKLETAFNELQNKWNAFAAAYVPGGPSTQGLPPTANQSTGDITTSKIDEIKVPS